MHLAEEADNNFPDVVRTILPLLGPVDHPDMLIYEGTRDGNAHCIRGTSQQARADRDRGASKRQDAGSFQIDSRRIGD